MKQHIILFLFFFSLVLPLKALPTDSIWTVYKNGEFTTECQQRVNASGIVVSEVTDNLVFDFHHNPSHLFNWALKELGLQEKGNEVIIIHKSSTNDEKTGITHGLFDIVIQNVTTFKNVRVDAKVGKTRMNNGISKVTAEIQYSSFLLDKAFCVFTVIPQKNNEQIFITNVKIKFGWFFNLFITRKRYKSIVEWRVRKFTDNMHLESENRQKAKN